jgi:ATP-dependent helicase/nuclease subunit A
MSQINIIKASAGSGKTHFLTGKYLELLICEPTDYFKSILAVTFTNKATEEMKVRILEQLSVLASGGKSDYLEDLKQKTGYKESLIRNKSSAILKQILHGYSWFSIETIDTFFQKAIKAFARELSIPGNYNIEIDTKPALNFAVDNLLEEMEEGSELLNWLIQYSEARIDEGQLWDIKDELLYLGQEIFKESFAAVSSDIYSLINDKEKLSTFQQQLAEIIKETEKTLVNFGAKGLKIITDNSFEPIDLYQGNKGIINYFRKLSEKQLDEPNSYIIKMLDGPENWPSQKTPRRAEIISVASKQLLPLLEEIITYFNDHSVRYFTAKEILKNLYSLGILSDLADRIHNYCRDNNSFILSDSPVFIHRIIDHNEAPFIYEKVGNRYNHFMIDEFQDTSVMQWNNFKPLIINSLAMGKDCYIVGDVKQSIYRWRNSNWETLAKHIFKQFSSEQIRSHTLETNWRSCKEIVHFNNLFFPEAAAVLNSELVSNSNDKTFQNISDLYSDSQQLVANKNINKGKVIIRFFDTESTGNDPEYYSTPILSEIKTLLEKGYSPGDIAILVRQKKEGKTIADLLIEKNTEDYFGQPVQVISNESLFLNSSHCVNLLVSAIQYLADPKDQINLEKLLTCYKIVQQKKEYQHIALEIDYNPTIADFDTLRNLLPARFIESLNSLLALPLYELTEKLISIFALDITMELAEAENPYIHGFLDQVFEFTQNHSSDISKFIEFWIDEGMNKSISVSEKQDAIKILTIHKSKGLEFKAVIIPFCNWKLNQKPGTVLWANTTSDDFGYLPVYPVNYAKNLLKTEFEPYYEDELLKSYVDNLNLLYVSMTRAIEVLIAYSVYNKNEKKKSAISTAGELIYQTISGSGNKALTQHFNDEEKVFESGELVDNKKINKEPGTPSIMGTSSGQAIDKLFCRFLSFDYFSNLNENQISPAKHGSILHSILSDIRTRDEFEIKFNKAVFEGLIDLQEASELLVYLNNCMDNPLISSWFSPDAEILNEAEIILPDGIIKRPDRVVIFHDHINIVDYKFGNDQQEEDYRRQVDEYKSVCSRMGYTDIKGYLWYITLNQIVEVY